jgi:hypothetical protein
MPKCQERHVRIMRSPRKSDWYDYEWQKKCLNHCSEKYETEAKKVAEILGL